MNELTQQGEKTMTVKEVAEALGVSRDTIENSIKDLESQSVFFRIGKIQGDHGGKPYYVLNEAQVTAIKLNLEKKFEVKTRLEKALLIRQAMQFQDELIADLQQENEALKAENVTLKPKAEYHDRLVDASHLTNFRDTAKELGISQQWFIEWLEAHRYIYHDAQGVIKPYADKMAFFSIKDYETNGHAGTQTRITVDGKTHFLRVFGGQTSLFTA
jgi:excisionase family DNA binding protein